MESRARPLPRPSVRERLSALAEETGTDEFVHGLLAFLTELAAERPGHPILSTLVDDVGRQASEAVSAGLLHDIGNLLQITSSQLDLMQRDLGVVLDPSRLDPSRRAQMHARFMDGLATAREAAHGAGELSRRSVESYARSEVHADITEVLATAFDLGRRVVGRRAELSLDARVEGRVVASRADLLRVLVNLIRNAADAVEGEMGAMVMIEAWQTPDRAFVSVADNGPGIAEDAAERVFELFYTTKGHGNGVGLFVCNMLVTGWGGELQVDSRRGHGARFTASVPRLRET